MAGKLSEVSTGFIAVNAANRMPTDNKEKEPRRRSAGDGVASFNHPFPSVTSTQGHNKGHRAPKGMISTEPI